MAVPKDPATAGVTNPGERRERRIHAYAFDAVSMIDRLLGELRGLPGLDAELVAEMHKGRRAVERVKVTMEEALKARGITVLR
jgi:hypothetical protein